MIHFNFYSSLTQRMYNNNNSYCAAFHSQSVCDCIMYDQLIIQVVYNSMERTIVIVQLTGCPAGCVCRYQWPPGSGCAGSE